MIDTNISFSGFLGSNTPAGFQSHFSALLDVRSVQHLYLIKGGPGTGKSTLMKSIAAAMEQDGFAVQRYYCSGDPDSLDAIYLPALKVAVADGTPPHAMEPVFPGCHHSIINLGDQIDEDRIIPHAAAIRMVSGAIGKCFEACYRNLKTAAELTDQIEALSHSAADAPKLARLATRLCRRFLPTIGSPTVQHCYFSAFTPKGLLDTSANLTAERTLCLFDPFGIAPLLTEPLLNEAVNRGTALICGHDPLSPRRMIQLYYPNEGALLRVCEEKPNDTAGEKVVDLSHYMNVKLLHDRRKQLRLLKKMRAGFLSEADSALKAAKASHDVLESYYRPCVDFDGVNQRRDALLAELAKKR